MDTCVPDSYLPPQAASLQRKLDMNVSPGPSPSATVDQHTERNAVCNITPVVPYSSPAPQPSVRRDSTLRPGPRPVCGQDLVPHRLQLLFTVNQMLSCSALLLLLTHHQHR
jgi:hypothetical protein